jgi:UDP-N-acetyl-D-glucosamine dehydrogenase
MLSKPSADREMGVLSVKACLVKRASLFMMVCLRYFSRINLTRHSLDDLSRLVESKRAKIGVFGAGYVGLPLACAFAEAGFRTTAVDSDLSKVHSIRNGLTYVEDDYVRQNLATLVKTGSLTSNEDVGAGAEMSDFLIVTVPTPLDDFGEPDLSYVTGLAETFAEKIRAGKFIIVESSVYPGTTEEIVKPILERGGLRAGTDFGLAYSPERIDYGNSKYNLKDIPKVVGGVTPSCTRIAATLYRCALGARIVEVSNTGTAEATKMLENTYRYVNIALANELAVLHERLGIDFYEVIAAASTKPFGFQPFYPGPGVGGHCIPKDPHYLDFRARQLGIPLKLIKTAQDINESMTNHLISRLENYLQEKHRSLHGSKVAILGLAFKQDVSDTRNSPSVPLAERLRRMGAEVVAFDPFAKSVSMKTGSLVSGENLNKVVERADVLVLVTPHTSFRKIDLSKLKPLTENALILDTRGFWSPEECRAAGFDYLGLGRPE